VSRLLSDSGLTKPKPLILIGGGGHASLMGEILIGTSRNVLAVVCPESTQDNAILSRFYHVRNDEYVLQFPPDSVELVMGIGKMPGSALRQQVMSTFSNFGYTYASVISPTALVSRFATVSEGVQILPGAIVNAFAHLAANAIINSGSIVEHDCHIGDHVHIAPGALLCGGVTVGSETIVGPRATIARGCSIGSRVLIGAGSAVVRNIPSDTKVLPGEKAFLTAM